MEQFRDALTWANERLQSAHVPHALREAALLLGLACDQSTFQVWANPGTILSPTQSASFRQLVERRAKGEPVAYLRGEVEFYGLPFRVGPAVLIPRPETELLVQAVLEWLPESSEEHVLADLGTGSGAIAVAVAKQRPALRIHAIDLDSAALEVAQENAQRNGVADRIIFAQGDLYEPLERAAVAPLKAILSNPPYVATELGPAPDEHVTGWEPPQALFGGADGLAVIRRCIEGAPAYLQRGGRLYLEFGYAQEQGVREITERAGLDILEIRYDYAGIPRILVAERRA